MSRFGARAEYMLLNKDNPILRFACERDDLLNEQAFYELEWLSELRPIGYADITIFLE